MALDAYPCPPAHAVLHGTAGGSATKGERDERGTRPSPPAAGRFKCPNLNSNRMHLPNECDHLHMIAQ